MHKSHNVTVLLYHMVFPAKYRRAEFDQEVDGVVRDVYLEIDKRYHVKFLEIGVSVGQLNSSGIGHLTNWAPSTAWRAPRSWFSFPLGDRPTC